MSMASSRSPLVANEVPTLRAGLAVRGAACCPAAGLAHAVALAVGRDDVVVVHEPVGQDDGGAALGQEAAPFLEWPVACDREAEANVGGGDEAEQQLGAGAVQRCEPDLVADDQVLAQDGLDELSDAGSAGSVRDDPLIETHAATGAQPPQARLRARALRHHDPPHPGNVGAHER